MRLMPVVDESRRQKVSFSTAGGLSLAGHLYPRMPAAQRRRDHSLGA
jgi:hypothetical protein